MPELDDLETLADDIRATAPRPRDAYVDRLAQRVDAGFAPEPAARARGRRERGWFWAPGVALAASVVVALAVAAGVLSGGRGSDENATPGGGAAAAPAFEQPSSPPVNRAEEAQGGGVSDGTAAPLTAAPAPEATGARRVERRSTLALAPGRDAFGEVTAGVLRIADASGTIVQRSTVSERDGRGYATYDLRVPASRLDEVLEQLSELATVTSRTASDTDITTAFTSAAARLDDARAERRALLRALARADGEREADALRARVRVARARIGIAERDVRRLRARTDRARLDVTVASTGLDGDGGAWTPRDALDDGRRVLEVAAGVAVVAGAVLLPLLVLLALAAAAARVTRRRRREAALG